MAPTRASVLGAKAATAGRVAAPPAAVASRQVVAKKTPPPPPVPFAKQQQALAAHPGQPLARNEVQTLRPAAAAAARPMVKQAPPGKPATPNMGHPANLPTNQTMRRSGQPALHPAQRPAGESSRKSAGASQRHLVRLLPQSIVRRRRSQLPAPSNGQSAETNQRPGTSLPHRRIVPPRRHSRIHHTQNSPRDEFPAAQSVRAEPDCNRSAIADPAATERQQHAHSSSCSGKPGATASCSGEPAPPPAATKLCATASAPATETADPCGEKAARGTSELRTNR